MARLKSQLRNLSNSRTRKQGDSLPGKRHWAVTHRVTAFFVARLDGPVEETREPL